MKQRLIIAIAGICCLYANSACSDTMLEIHTGLNALHQVQDEIATGVSDAAQLQNAILDRLVENFEKSGQSLLTESGYQTALAELALSGGDRVRMARLIHLSLASGKDQPILIGITAYLEGRMEEAALAFEKAEGTRKNLTGIDHLLALAKGTALLDSDLPKAREALEYASLYAPGTLVEEVAMRRLARISIKQNDPELFVRCATLYLRRYDKSPFAPEFMSVFVQGAQTITNSNDIARLGDLVLLLPAADARHLLFETARGFLSEGKVSFAAMFADRLRRSVHFNEKTLMKDAELRLLEMLVEPKKGQASEKLAFLQNGGEMDTSLENTNLMEIARHVIWNLYKPLGSSSASKGSADQKLIDAPKDFSSVDPILARARTTLESEAKVKAP